MLGFFGSDPYVDATLGPLRRRHGAWVGQCTLGSLGSVELRIAGGRKAPDDASLQMAIATAARFASLRDELAAALFEHYEPYRDSARSEDTEDESQSVPTLTGAADVWSHVAIEAVVVDASAREFQVEIRLAAAWDEEHTLGLRLGESGFVELCGSVGP